MTAGVLLSGLLGVGIDLWASRSALRPLTDLTRAASRMAAGDLAALAAPPMTIPISRPGAELQQQACATGAG